MTAFELRPLTRMGENTWKLIVYMVCNLEKFSTGMGQKAAPANIGSLNSSFDPLRTRFGPQLRGQPPQLPWQSRI